MRFLDGNYDSPTFLGRRDKLLLGMTFPQVVVFMASFVLWSAVAFSFDMGVMGRLLMFGPLHGVTVAMFTVKIGGVLIPFYLVMMVKGSLFVPLYHSTDREMRLGLPEWEGQREQRRFGDSEEDEALPDGTLARLAYSVKQLRRRNTRQARAEAVREMGYLAEVEAEHHGYQAVQESKQWLRQMWRMLRK